MFKKMNFIINYIEEIEGEEKTIKEDKTIPENTLLIMIHEIKGLDEKKKYD